MGLVDGEQGDLRAVEQGQEARGEQALGGDVEQVDPAGQQLALHARGSFAVEGGVEVLGAYTELRSEEHTSELQSLMRISYAVFCLKKKKVHRNTAHERTDKHIEYKHEASRSSTDDD